MKYASLKHFLNNGMCTLLVASSCLAFSGVVVNADSAESEIVTVDINEDENKVISHMVAETNVNKGVKRYLQRTDLNDVSLGSTGFDVEEMLVKPKPIILDRFGVPDGEGVCNSLNKTYMAYTAVTSKNSNQYKLLYGDSAYTDAITGLRMVDGRYCIATGTFYASQIGTKLNLIMADGNVVECILGDVKSDEHTDPTHRYQKWDGSVVEMIVDYEYFNSTSQYPEALKGRVMRIEVVE